MGRYEWARDRSYKMDKYKPSRDNFFTRIKKRVADKIYDLTDKIIENEERKRGG